MNASIFRENNKCSHTATSGEVPSQADCLIYILARLWVLQTRLSVARIGSGATLLTIEIGQEASPVYSALLVISASNNFPAHWHKLPTRSRCCCHINLVKIWPYVLAKQRRDEKERKRESYNCPEIRVTSQTDSLACAITFEINRNKLRKRNPIALHLIFYCNCAMHTCKPRYIM